MQAGSYGNSPQNPLGREIARRHFLKISATGIFGALTFGALGNSAAFAQSSGGPGSALQQEFEEAAEEFGVPAEVLIAMGYVNTRWEMPPADASEYEEGEIHGWGGYGIMALVKNPSTNTLSEAAQLTGLSEEELKTDRRANIRGGAALLAESQKKQGRSAFGRNRAQQAREQKGLGREELGDWLESVSGRGALGALGVDGNAPAAAGIGGGEVYTGQVSLALKQGVSGETESGEKIGLKAREVPEQALSGAGVS
jgi:hypothetical protein